MVVAPPERVDGYDKVDYLGRDTMEADWDEVSLNFYTLPKTHQCTYTPTRGYRYETPALEP